ncbi:MAG: hypothetical protein Q7T63_02075 [Burkholderiaceae bacterium]|nr:hypothetical protein [Burkholderiaceae bacterium]MDO9088880.1 hypothetical protein [Burkholderiaceae bacterium]
MTTSSLSKSTRDAAQRATDEAMQAVEDAADGARAFVHDAVDKVSDTVNDLRRSIEPVIDRISHTTQDLAHRGVNAAAQARDNARRTATQYTRTTQRYVSSRPIRSVVIAAAAGAIIATLLMSLRRSDN